MCSFTASDPGYTARHPLANHFSHTLSVLIHSSRSGIRAILSPSTNMCSLTAIDQNCSTLVILLSVTNMCSLTAVDQNCSTLVILSTVQYIQTMFIISFVVMVMLSTNKA